MGVEIALGMGDNVDYEMVWDSHIIEELARRHGLRAAELDAPPPVRSERDLLISILAFVRAGVGGERHVSSSAILEEFVRPFAMKVSLGGTPVRAAIAMRKLGHKSALHLVTINDHVRRLIPHDSPWVCSNDRDTLHPHLIVQWNEGVRVTAGDIEISAPRANRIIYHDDFDNISMRLNEAFGDLVTDAGVFLVSGFNAMQDAALLDDRLETLVRILHRLPPHAQVFSEDASFFRPEFGDRLRERLAGRIHIHSLNEDELQAHLQRRIDVLDVTQVAAALNELYPLLNAPLLVVHSMYWALSYGPDAARLAPALKGGVTMATTRFRRGDDLDAAACAETASLPANEHGARFARDIKALLGDRVCCVAVALVSQENATTVGLGDAFVGGFLPELLP